jgi:pimeloyl-ACP methyl ester carboxylesterase
MSAIEANLSTAGVGPVKVSVSDIGAGRPYLLLHGGAGPLSVASFAQLLSNEGNARVLTPTHPGFGGTPRPESLNSIAGLAAVYAKLLEHLDLREVTVVGNSIGGWIASELALLDSSRLARVVLVGAVGIEVEGHPVADPFTLSLGELMQRSYHNPAAFQIDPTKMSDAQKAGMAANRAALAVYGGNPSKGDASLRGRLAKVRVPTLVISGESDRVADPTYGKAFADAIPNAYFQVLPATGHMPHIETPAPFLRALLDFVGASRGSTGH